MVKMKKQIALVLGIAAMAVFLAFGALTFFGPDTAQATHQPANKVAVSASGIDTATVDTTGPLTGTLRILGPATMKTSSPTDLVISVTAESALWTNVKAGLSEDSEAFAQAKVYVVIDGDLSTPDVPDVLPGGFIVPVSTDEGVTADTGKVVFNDRTFRIKTNFDALTVGCTTTACIELYLRTRSANAFNWITLNVGSGIHTIEVFADLTVSATGTADAAVLVGKRTLVVHPEKLASDATAP
jgi:hypothetical protein